MFYKSEQLLKYYYSKITRFLVLIYTLLTTSYFGVLLVSTLSDAEELLVNELSVLGVALLISNPAALGLLLALE